MDEFDYTPEWVSRPFSYVFLTAVKWVISVLIVLAVIAALVVIVATFAGAAWLSLD